MELAPKANQLPHYLEELGLRLGILKVQSFALVDLRLVNLLQNFVLVDCLLKFQLVLLNDTATPVGLRTLRFLIRARLLFDLELHRLGRLLQP